MLNCEKDFLMEFYTNFYRDKDSLYLRYIKDGIRSQKKIPMEYSLYVPNPNGKYKEIYGSFLEKKDFNSIKELTDFVETYKDSTGFKLCGFNRYEYTMIDELYTGDDVKFNFSDLVVVSTDIEVETEGGYAQPEDPWQEINLITMNNKFLKKRITLGIEPISYEETESEYICCRTEKNILKKFLMVMKEWNPDILTGWNIEGYDIPYIINRIKRVLGENFSSSISPWNKIQRKTIKTSFGAEQESYDIYGVSILDYLALYRKYTYSEQESYKLDHIGKVELDLKKIDYSEYTSLKNLRRDNWNLFVRYNIRDDVIVDRLDNKLKFIELACNLAYLSKCNFEDVFTISRIWDVEISNYLRNHENIIVPLNGFSSDKQSVEGGFVKEPIKGFHEWCISEDFTSLYPHNIMGANISPETMMPQEDFFNLSVDDIVENDILMEEVTKILKEKNISLTGNGATYSREKRGFFPILMEKWFNLRRDTKSEMLEKEAELQDVLKELEMRGLTL